PGEMRMARREEAAGTLDEVARPYEMIAAELVVALGLSPRNRQARDQRTEGALVLVDGDGRRARPEEIQHRLRQLHRRAIPRSVLAAVRSGTGRLVRLRRQLVLGSDAHLVGLRGVRTEPRPHRPIVEAPPSLHVRVDYPVE